MKTDDPTIMRLVREHENYVPSYKMINGLPYEKPVRERTLIPPRILMQISKTGNSLQWKADELNVREKRYAQMIKANHNRKYPIWRVCYRCGNHLALQYRRNMKIRCEDCKWKRLSKTKHRKT